MDLPWVDTMLKLVASEYKLPPPSYKQVNPTSDDYNYIMKNAMEEDPFDKSGLKKNVAHALFLTGEATLQKTVCEYGEIMLVSSSGMVPTWNTWWRAIRLLSPKKRVRILIFASEEKRTLPLHNAHIGAEHVNGGSAYRCNPGTIVIYRREEATRVLIHELFHASCTDPYHKDVPHVEANTEAWAELILCAMAAKGNPNAWVRHMHEQLSWSARQAATLRDKYSVKSPKDYAWRYIVGRLHVWERLGIRVPNVGSKYKPVDSLKFTICEPKDI